MDTVAVIEADSSYSLYFVMAADGCISREPL